MNFSTSMALKEIPDCRTTQWTAEGVKLAAWNSILDSDQLSLQAGG